MSLAALARIACQYHERLEVIRRAKQHIGVPELEARLHSWMPLFAPFTLLDTRIEIRCLTDADQLREHAQELHHCVERYVSDCVSGASHIVGLFRAGRAIATAELKLGVGTAVRVAQLAGIHNSSAPKEARSALNVLLRELRTDNTETCMRRSRRRLRLYLTPRPDLERSIRQKRKVLTKYRTLVAAGYDVRDPVAVNRVLTAWRFAMPGGMRAAWEKGRDAVESVENARAWLMRWQARDERSASSPRAVDAAI